MRISSLSFKHFRSLASVTIPLGSTLTYLGGWNDVGKSSIIDGLLWTLLGHCRGTDAAGRGAAALYGGGIARGGMVGTVALADGTTIRRILVPGQDVTLEINDNPVGVQIGQQALLDKLGVNQAVLEALLQTDVFLNLEKAEAMALLLRVLDVKIPSDDPTEGAIPHAEAATRYDAAFKKRTDVARDVKALAAQIPADVDKSLADDSVPSDDELRDLDDQMTGLRAELGRKEQNQAAAGGENAGRRSRLTEEATSLRARIQVDTATLRGLGDKAAILKKKEDTLAGLQGKTTGERLTGTLPLDTQTETLRTALAQDGERVTSLRITLERIPAAGVSSCVLSTEIACPADPKVFKDERQRLDKLVKATEKAVGENQKKLDALIKQHADEQTRGREMEALRKEIGELLAYQQRRTSLADGLKKNAEALQTLDAEIADLGEPARAWADPDLEALRTRVTAGEKTVREARDLAAKVTGLRKSYDALKGKRTDLAALEAQVTHYGPKGAAALALAGAMTQFEEAVNEALALWGYQVKIETQPWTVLVNGRAAGLLAKSVRHRLGICLQLALADLTGLGFVAIDEADMLDDRHRGTLVALLQGWKTGQALVAGTAREDFTAGEDVEAGLRFVKVERPALDGPTTIALD